MTRSEWLVNQHRDSYSTYIGHYSLMSYIAVAENKSVGRMRFEFLEVRAPRLTPRGCATRAGDQAPSPSS